MSENWTKGPWTAFDGKHYPNIQAVTNDGFTQSIADTCASKFIDGGGDDAAMANAHLIAASPRMYSKLKDLLDVLPDGEWSNTKQEIREILSDARGES